GVQPFHSKCPTVPDVDVSKRLSRLPTGKWPSIVHTSFREETNRSAGNEYDPWKRIPPHSEHHPPTVSSCYCPTAPFGTGTPPRRRCWGIPGPKSWGGRSRILSNSPTPGDIRSNLPS